MSFAILQDAADLPPLDVVKQCLKTLPGFTEADAGQFARRFYGVVTRGLGREAALAFQSVCARSDWPVSVVEESALPRLPERKFVNRLELAQAALLLYDPLGRAVPVLWNHVSAVAAGQIHHFKMTTTTVIDHAENCDPEHWMGQNFKKHKEHKVEDIDEVQLDLVIAEGRMRFSIEAREFMFGYVFKRPELEFHEKFALLIRMLTERAAEASVNRGAQALLQQGGLGLVYPSIGVFNDETVWLLHRRRLQTGPAASAEPPPASEPSAAA